jgi:hypothetical protein
MADWRIVFVAGVLAFLKLFQRVLPNLIRIFQSICSAFKTRLACAEV